MGITVVVPCKLLRESKSRLAQVLTPHARYALSRHLLDRTLKIAGELTHFERVFVVTGDPVVAMQAKALGAGAISDEFNELNSALTAARDRLMHIAPLREGLLVLPIDLVFADAAALRKLADCFDVAIAADESKSGTNALFLQGGAVAGFPFCFGTESLARHSSAARSMGYSFGIIDDPVLAFDLDEPADYRRATARTGLELAAS
jgi:2-phospho-L-lactate guanylyltransferase